MIDRLSIETPSLHHSPLSGEGRPRPAGLRHVALVLLALALASGCGGVRDHLRKYNSPPEKTDPFVQYMDGSVGHLTFDEALTEWGHPSLVTDGERIFLATWGPAEARKAGGEFGRLFFERKVSPDENVNLVFDVETRMLASWGFSRK